ncbi:MAG: DUF3794 domain-containing protein [Ruminococcus sp.]|nr:DUF3794 domain-containing protein [Ruminococcus sp.]
MECKINREMIPVTETVLDETQEQDVSLDYVLPDYDPEIFRIICCEIQPSVAGYQVSGGRLTYDLRAELRVLYCGGDSKALQCVTQTMNYSKSLDLPAGREGEPVFCFYPKADYASCRATGKRRLDVRGAVSVRIRATAQRKQEVISDIFGMEMQLQRKNVTTAAEKRTAVKNLSLSEEITLGASRPAVLGILRCNARAAQGERSIIAGKLVARGEVVADVLYRGEGPGGGSAIETMRFTIPYSQIVDMEQIDETFTGTAEVQVISFTVKPASDSSGEMRILQCSAELRLTCTACKTKTVSIVTDAYSTRYLSECTAVPLRVDGAPVPVSELFTCSASIRAGESGAEVVSDLRCHVKNVSMSAQPGQGKLRISGMLCASVLTLDSDGMPVLLEREEAFEEQLPLNLQADDALLYAAAEPADSSYHLGADGVISIKCSVRLCGTLYPTTLVQGLTQIQADEEKKIIRDSDCALRLYYGTAGESIWEIAKRCSTKVSAITEENDLSGDTLTQPGMLLIPIVY